MLSREIYMKDISTIHNLCTKALLIRALASKAFVGFGILLSLVIGFSISNFTYANTLIIHDDARLYPVSSNAEYLQDQRELFSPDQLLTEKDNLFIQNDESHLAFGISDSIYWLKVKFIYRPYKEQSPKDWYFIIRSSHQAENRVWAYLQSDVKNNVQGRLTEDNYLHGTNTQGRAHAKYQPLPITKQDWRDDAYKIVVEPEQEITLLVRQSLFGSNQTQIFLASELEIANSEPASEFAFGLFYGFLLTVFLLAILLFVFVNEQSLLFYALYTCSLFISMMTLTGHGEWLMWPSQKQISVYITNYSSVAILLSLVSFTRQYIDLRRYSSLWDNILLADCGLIICLAVLSSISVNQLFLLFSASVAILSLSLILLSVGIAFLQGNQEARNFMLSFVPLVTLGGLWGLNSLDLFDTHMVSDHWVIMGVSLQVLILGFGLGNQLIYQSAAYVTDHHLNLMENRETFALEESLASQDSSDERYWELFQESLDPVFLCQFDGGFLSVNKAFIRLLGYENIDKLLGAGNLYSMLSFDSQISEENFYDLLNVYQPIRNYPLNFKHYSGNFIRTTSHISVTEDHSLGRNVILGEVHMA